MIITKIFLPTIFLFSFIIAPPTILQNNIYSKINSNLETLISDKYNVREKIIDNQYLIFGQNLGNSSDSNKSAEITDEDVKKNREKNRNLLFFILAGFVAIVLITFIVVYSYLKCRENSVSPQVIEEDQNYSDIGGLTPSKTDPDSNKEEKNDENKKEEQ